MVTNTNVTDPGMRITFLLSVRNKLIVVADLSVIWMCTFISCWYGQKLQISKRFFLCDSSGQAATLKFEGFEGHETLRHYV